MIRDALIRRLYPGVYLDRSGLIYRPWPWDSRLIMRLHSRLIGREGR